MREGSGPWPIGFRFRDHQDNSYCDRLCIYAYLPMRFSGMRPSKLIVKMFFFRLFFYIYLGISKHGLECLHE